MRVSADTIFTIIIPTFALACVLFYLHVMLFFHLPKKLSAFKTFLYFVYIIFMVFLIVVLLSEEIISLRVAVLLMFLACIPQLLIMREKVAKDVNGVINMFKRRR